MEHINQTEYVFDVPMLVQEVNSITKTVPFAEYGDQICVTQRPGVNDLRDGCGSIWLKEEQRFRALETEFTEINPLFKNTYIAEIIRTLPMNFGRVRIMNMRPRAVYSFHKDTEIRYHLALITNPNAWIIYRDKPPYHIPADGHLYSMDATKRHTAINLGDESRVHLVFNDVNRDYWNKLDSTMLPKRLVESA